MKRILGLGCAAVMALSMSSFASTIDIYMPYSGDFVHESAYYWRVNVDSYIQSYVATGEELTGAVLTIEGINNIPEPDYNDILYVTLLDVKKPYNSSNPNQIKSYNDDTWNNYFSNVKKESDTPFDNFTASTVVGSYTDNNSYDSTINYGFWINWKGGKKWITTWTEKKNVNPIDNVSWNLDVNTINAYKNDYNGYASSGFIGIGLDPDCHYEGRVKLTLTTTPTNVPEPGTLSLMIIGLSSLAGALVMKKKKN